MAIARITDIRGLVTVGENAEEILKNRDLISEHGGKLTIGEFAKIIFDDGREVEVTGPVTFNLDSTFFNEGTFEDSITQISDLSSLEYINANFEDLLNANESDDNLINQVSNTNTIETEQLDTSVSSNQAQLNDTRTLSTNPEDNSTVFDDNANSSNENLIPEDVDDQIIVPTINLSSLSDTGESNTDNITNDNTPTITGTGEAGSSFVITSSDGTVLGSGIVDGDGNYSITISTLPEGLNDLTVTTTDAAGNISSSNLEIEIDTSISAGTVTIATVSGDDVINAVEDDAATIAVSGTATGGDISTGDPVTVTVNGNDYTTTVGADGSYTVNVDTADLQADNTIDAKVDSTDAAGNSVTSNATPKTVTFNPNNDPDAIDDTTSTVEVTTTTTIFDSSFENDGSGFVNSASGWDSDGKIELRNETTDNGSAADGDKYIELNIDSSGGYDDAPNIYRDVSTVDGAEYNLDFDFSARPGYNANVCKMELLVNGEVVGTYSADGTSLSGPSWQNGTVSFTGDGSDMRIEFREAGTDVSGGRGMFIDDIELTQTVTTTQEQNLTTDEDTAITVDVLKNDTDIDSDSLTINEIQGQDVSGGQTVNITQSGTIIGTATVVNGKIEFTPGENLQSMNDGQNQNISFEYGISDGMGGLDSANVSINVTGSTDNYAPVSSDDNVSTNEDVAYTFTVNDFGYSDTDGDSLSAVQITDLPSNGILTLNGTTVSDDAIINVSDINAGNLVFTPSSNSDTDTSLNFKVSDGQDWSGESTTTITINAVADNANLIATINSETVISGTSGGSFGETDTFNGSTEGWSGSGISNVNGSQLGIGYSSNEETATKTFSFGAENANQTVTISFDTTVYGGWDSSGNYQDYLKANVNGTEVYSHSDFSSGSGSFTATTDASGNLTIALTADTTSSSEGIGIDNFTISGTSPTSSDTYQYDFDITNSVIDASETLSSVTVSSLPNGATLSAGTNNGDGTWTVSQNELSGLKINSTSKILSTEDVQVSVTTTDGTDNKVTSVDATVDVPEETVIVNGDVLFSEDFNSGIDGWSGDAISNSSNSLQIGYNSTGTDTAFKRFDFGTENAGKTVTVSFDADTVGSWDSGNNNTDYISVSSSDGTEINWDSSVNNSYSFESVVQSDGTIDISIHSYTTGSSEAIQIDNLEIVASGSDWIQTAQLVDGIVEGAYYETSSGITGYTDENGNFSFRAGDDVTFSIGGVTLGIATAEDIQSGQTFLQDIADVSRTDLNDEYLENMAVFLQSIDTADSGDNIVITTQMSNALENADIDLRTASEEEVQQLIESVGGTYVDESEAMVHVQEMLEEYAGLEKDSFDEHIDDDINNAVLGKEAQIGIAYETSSGLNGVTNESGTFEYNDGDTITFTKDGEVLSTIDSANIGDDSLITFNELQEFNQNEIDFDNLELDLDNLSQLLETDTNSTLDEDIENVGDLELSDMLHQDDSEDSLSELLGEDKDAGKPDNSKISNENDEKTENSDDDSYDPFKALEENSNNLISNMDLDETIINHDE